MIEPVIVEVPNPGHPFGVRGAGEANIVPPPAALANAIYDAIGVRMTSLPMCPRRLWRLYTIATGRRDAPIARVVLPRGSYVARNLIFYLNSNSLPSAM